MSLEEYRRKRHFAKTPEPDGERSTGKPGNRFVIQKHAASRLHYDLRIEMDGVLKSWAVPKGPCLDPSQKRLAIQTEDHPLAYFEFEGVIPKGEYGGGTVLVWDVGTWQPLNENGFATGDFKFHLSGQKLQGGWMLVHTGRRRGDPKHWLLFKERDEHVRVIEEYDVLADLPLSVLSNRSLESIQASPATVWTGGQPSDLVERLPGLKSSRISQVAGAKRQKFPSTPPRPALPTATKSPPSGSQWVHELKYDGYRMLCLLHNGKVNFISRNGNDWTDKLKFLAANVDQLSVKSAIIDGEVAAVGASGVTEFQLLQNLIGRGNDGDLKFFVFDLLYINGFDITSAILSDRKSLLQEIIPPNHPVISFSEHLDAPGELVFEHACRLGAEGIVSKRIDRRYPEGRTEEWLKIKSLKSGDFVVGGFTDSKATRGRSFGALVVGQSDKHGDLVYVGRVGTGFTEKTIEDLSEQLHKIEIEDSPFTNLDSAEVGRDFHWVKPIHVIVVEYAGWTNDRQLRFPSFRGQRVDIRPQDVRQSQPDEEIPEADVLTQDETLEIPSDSLGALANIRFTHPDRIMYPNDGVTKLGLAAYTAQIAKWMLPFVIDRPLSLVRCPKGCQGKCFFQKKPPAGVPECIETVLITSTKKQAQHATVIRDIVGLLSLVQFSSLEIHTWGCREDRSDRPDTIVFDIDPDTNLGFEMTSEAALLLRAELDQVGLRSFAKTSGGKGIHVVVPLRRRNSWDDVRIFCEGLAGEFVRQWPGSFTNTPSKSARRGKIYLDVLRNRFGATTIAPYSTRARDGAAVSMPVAWEEISELPSGNCFTVMNAQGRLINQSEDPWQDFFDCNQSLTKKMIAHYA